MSEVHYKSGDQAISPRFLVAVQPAKDGAPFRLLPLKDLAGVKASNPELSTQMPQSSGTQAMEDGSESYRVMEAPAPGQQIIEVVNVGSSTHSTSRYKTTAIGIEPISFQSSNVGQMVLAMLVGTLLGVGLRLLGHGMRKVDDVQMPIAAPPQV
jgi:hypothetical protein